MEAIHEWVADLSGFAWGPVMIALLVGTGVLVTIRTRCIQFWGFVHGHQLLSGRYEKPSDPGEISHFQALSAALSATIGTGNIAGVATAIALGGPGAVFWMWITAVVGMCTKYCECLLSVKYRTLDPDGKASGGPMYYLEKGLGQKWLAVAFAVFALVASFGIGNMVQANSVAEPLWKTFGIPKLVSGMTMAVLTGLVIIGGIKRIGQVAARVVPFMCLVYVGSALFILVNNYHLILSAFELILTSAFSPTSAAGGFAGAVVAQTVRFGVARGVFSNEAGLGSAPMAHGAAKTKEPVREGLVAMLGPFIDTLVICTMTALVIIISGAWSSGNTGSVLTSSAYEHFLPGAGHYIVVFGLVFFAYSTMISWSYYGDRCARYLFGEKAVLPYHWAFVGCILVGATSKLDLVWNFSDAMNGLMAIPNLIAVVLLSGVVVRETRRYFHAQRIR